MALTAAAVLALTGCPLLGASPRPAVNERAAILNMHAIMNAQVAFQRAAYADADGDGAGDFGTLPQLRDPLGDGGSAALIDPLLGSGETGGYQFILRTEAGAEGMPPRYELRAFPSIQFLVGLRFFYVDETGIIRAAVAAQAGPDSRPIAGRDPDQDGIITSTEEAVYGANPQRRDTDNDGTPDNAEIAAVLRDPIVPD